MSYVLVALHWMQAHPAECWLALSAVLNITFRLRSPESWIALCDRHPGFATLMRVIRATGVDPVGALKALALLASAKAAGASLNSLSVEQAPPTPRDPSVRPPPPRDTIDTFDETRRP